MIIKELARYPVKGFNGESLIQATLEVDAGIVGNRRFALGVDSTVDDGVWRSSRNYLINAFNSSASDFLDAIPNLGKTPVLVDRSNKSGPKGHWDFPDSQLMIINLETIRELENNWNVEIDPKRFRYNILLEGVPAWSEFGWYGSRFSAADAQIDILRPARRCAATAVNPNTGDRDAEILQRLVKE